MDRIMHSQDKSAEKNKQKMEEDDQIVADWEKNEDETEVDLEEGRQERDKKEKHMKMKT